MQNWFCLGIGIASTFQSTFSFVLILPVRFRFNLYISPSNCFADKRKRNGFPTDSSSGVCGLRCCGCVMDNPVVCCVCVCVRKSSYTEEEGALSLSLSLFRSWWWLRRRQAAATTPKSKKGLFNWRNWLLCIFFYERASKQRDWESPAASWAELLDKWCPKSFSLVFFFFYILFFFKRFYILREG